MRASCSTKPSSDQGSGGKWWFTNVQYWLHTSLATGTPDPISEAFGAVVQDFSTELQDRNWIQQVTGNGTEEFRWAVSLPSQPHVSRSGHALGLSLSLHWKSPCLTSLRTCVLSPEHTLKEVGMVVHTCNPVIRRWRRVDSQASLVSQPSSQSRLLVSYRLVKDPETKATWMAPEGHQSRLTSGLWPLTSTLIHLCMHKFTHTHVEKLYFYFYSGLPLASGSLH